MCVVSTTTMRSMAQLAAMASAATAANDVARRPAMPAEKLRRRQRDDRKIGGPMQPVLVITRGHCRPQAERPGPAIAELCKKSRKTQDLGAVGVCPTKVSLHAGDSRPRRCRDRGGSSLTLALGLDTR